MIARAPRPGLAEAGGLFAAKATTLSSPTRGAEGHRARMRQKLLEAGPAALLDHELVEMVLFLALPRRDPKPIACALLERFGGFAEAIAAPNAKLREVEGLGEARVAAQRTVQAAALRLSERRCATRPSCTNGTGCWTT